MSNTINFLTRVLVDMFPGKPNSSPQQTPTASQPSTHTAASAQHAPAVDPGPRTIGCGAANETHITIDGIPNLFIDEGDCVMQFVPVFEEGMKETQFGIKVLPELEPHWSEAVMHRCSLKEAIAQSIRGRGSNPVPLTSVPRAGQRQVDRPVEHVVGGDDAEDDAVISPRRPAASGYEGSDMAAVSGTVTSWGEEKFPRRKPGGPRFYTSFAIRLQTISGERVLQGEGLKDAISDSGCQVGDVVSVRRLRKIKVQAFNQDGTAKVKDGKPILWDKWLWSIST